MTGFWVLARKELLEQRRTWKFLGMAGFFTVLALLNSIIPFIVMAVRGDPRDAEDARDVLRNFGISVFTLGTLLTIITGMGLLASERASGTAAMTLSKPVTRAAFVAAKFLGLVFSIFGALLISSAVIFVLALLLFGNAGLGGLAGFMAVIGVYLVFIGSITFLWSGMFTRQMLAGGLTLLIFIAQIPLSEIPHTQQYWPINAPEWAGNHFNPDNGDGGDTSDRWPALPITFGVIALLSVGTWGVFRKKEL